MAKKECLLMEGKRNGYSPDQCGKTMTVGELIGFLEDYDEDTPIYLSNDNGYTYGSISESSFDTKEFGDDEDEGGAE